MSDNPDIYIPPPMSVIISLKIDSEDRQRNLDTTLEYLSRSNLEIIIVEQDSEQRVKIRCSKYPIKHIFIKDDGFFNRQRGLNIGVKHATTDIIFHYDADVLFESTQTKKALSLIQEGKYDVVYPYDGRFYDVPKEYHDKISSCEDLTFINLQHCTLFNPNSVGGAVMFDKSVFINGGGANENFKGLGYEDNELFDRYLNLGYKVGRVRGPLYHLTHERKDTSYDKNPYGDNNIQEYQRIARMSDADLKTEVKTWNYFKKQQVFICDGVFTNHQTYASPFISSEKIKWNKNIEQALSTDMVIYTDTNIKDVRPFGNNVAWLCEPRAYHSSWYSWLENNHEKFNEIWTYDSKLLSMGDKFKLVPWGGTWLRTLDQKVYPKTKMCSIIASGKRQLEGHVFRHEVIKNISNVDVFGYGYNPVENKISALSDYRFSICIENTKSDWYFTEKIIDCFRTGTVPIYWGCKNIDQFFDPRGIITFNTIEELNRILDTLTPESYIEKYDYVLSNFKTSSEFTSIEDWLVSNKFIQ